MNELETRPLRLGLAKGRIWPALRALLVDAGIEVKDTGHELRPHLSFPDCEVKLLKARDVATMLAVGSRDAGFLGADWVAERGADLVEVLDTRLDPVEVVAAAPPTLGGGAPLPRRRLTVATEYPRLARQWIDRAGLDARIVECAGATEVFPPEDADLVVDNTASGETLRAHGLVVIATLLQSSTRFYATREAWQDPVQRRRIEDLAMLLRSVLEARRRVLLELNVAAAQLESVIAVLPCMKQPTVAPLHGGAGFAVKAAVLRADLPRLIPLLGERGASDLIVTRTEQIVP